MCLETGQYYGLGATATVIWRALDGRLGPDETCAQIAAGSSVPLATVERDYAEFVEGLARRGWLVDDSAPEAPGTDDAARRGRPARWHTATAWATLFAVALRLRIRGFPSAYGYATRRSRLEPAPVRGRPALPDALRAFTSAENSFFLSRRGPDDCLPRSLSLFVFLRRAGFPAAHRIGVADAPFAAHAWVECDGEAVFEAPDRVRRFTVLVTLP